MQARPAPSSASPANPAPARGFRGTLGPGEAVRIFTGAPVPDGADAILIQEDAAADGDAGNRHRAGHAGPFHPAGRARFPRRRRPPQRRPPARSARRRARRGDGPREHPGSPPPARRGPRHRRRARAARHPARPRPDRLLERDRPRRLRPRSRRRAASTSASRPTSLRGDRSDRPRTRATPTSSSSSVAPRSATTTSSRQALAGNGMELDFWRIAMRPGKPLMVGQLGPMRVLGLPGNPVSAFVCATLFLRAADPGSARRGA